MSPVPFNRRRLCPPPSEPTLGSCSWFSSIGISNTPRLSEPSPCTTEGVFERLVELVIDGFRVDFGLVRDLSGVFRDSRRGPADVLVVDGTDGAVNESPKSTSLVLRVLRRYRSLAVALCASEVSTYAAPRCRICRRCSLAVCDMISKCSRRISIMEVDVHSAMLVVGTRSQLVARCEDGLEKSRRRVKSSTNHHRSTKSAS
jgi:hypothetical protein